MTEQVVYRTKEMQRLEHRYGRPMGELLTEMYVERGMKLEEIGSELGLSNGAVSRWLSNFGIPTRKPGARTDAAA